MDIIRRSFAPHHASLLLLAATMGCGTGNPADVPVTAAPATPPTATGESLVFPAPPVAEKGPEAPARLAPAVDQVRQVVGTIDDQVGEAKGGVTRAVGEARGDLESAAGNLRNDVSEASKQARGEVQGAVDDARGNFKQAVDSTTGELRGAVDQARGGVKKAVEGARGEVRDRARSIEKAGQDFEKQVLDGIAGPRH